MIRSTHTTAFERVQNALEDEAYAEMHMAQDNRDFCDLLGDILDGFTRDSGSPWTKNPRNLALLSKLQDITSTAFNEADTALDKAKRDLESAGDQALDVMRERE